MHKQLLLLRSIQLNQLPKLLYNMTYQITDLQVEDFAFANYPHCEPVDEHFLTGDEADLYRLLGLAVVENKR